MIYSHYQGVEVKAVNIVVCIKQVPDTDDIKWSKENNIIRDGMISILNPYDEFAIQSAIDIKNEYEDTKITVITMGPPQAKSVLEYALAKGCDEGILLCDKKFAGSDTVATSKTLASCIKSQVGRCDLIFCGQFAIDGDTAQTGPSIASHLNISQVTFVKSILKVNDLTEKIVLKQERDNGYNIVEADFPCLVCMLKSDEQELYTPKIDDYIRASQARIKTLGANTLEISEDELGFKGSPTYVSKAFKPQINRRGEMLYSQGATGELSKAILEKIYGVNEYDK